MNNKLKTVKKNEYFQLKYKPSEKELSKYYQSVYFQQTKGSYEKKYSKDELKYIENNHGILLSGYKRIFKKSIKGKSFLDLGAGEGWALKYFHKAGLKTTGVDYSKYAIGKFNKNMLKYFIAEDISDFIKKTADQNDKYDIINLTNVIEHVLDPEELLISLKQILKKKGIISVTFPNDNSYLHRLLFNKDKIQNEFWIAYPDHISYFNKDSFSKMVYRLGFKPYLFIADFPIDLFLLNKHSNYILDKSKGKEAHFSRVDFINLISKLNSESAADLLIKLGDLGLGRNITALLKI